MDLPQLSGLYSRLPSSSHVPYMEDSGTNVSVDSRAWIRNPVKPFGYRPFGITIVLNETVCVCVWGCVCVWCVGVCVGGAIIMGRHIITQKLGNLHVYTHACEMVIILSSHLIIIYAIIQTHIDKWYSACTWNCLDQIQSLPERRLLLPPLQRIVCRDKVRYKLHLDHHLESEWAISQYREQWCGCNKTLHAPFIRKRGSKQRKEEQCQY